MPDHVHDVLLDLRLDLAGADRFVYVNAEHVTVAVVKLLRVVVWRLLRAHVVDDPAPQRKLAMSSSAAEHCACQAPVILVSSTSFDVQLLNEE